MPIFQFSSWNKIFKQKEKSQKPSWAKNPSARAMAWASLAQIITSIYSEFESKTSIQWAKVVFWSDGFKNKISPRTT